MASTGAVLYARATAVPVVAPGRITGLSLLVPARVLSGVWTATGVTALTDLRNLRSWLPPQRVKLVDDGGHMDATWYRFFQFVAEIKLGGLASPTIPDMAASVTASQVASTSSAAAVVAVVQQSQTNAEALSAVVEVAKTNSLAGANQIPPVQRTPYDIP